MAIAACTGRFEVYSYSENWFRDLKTHLDSGELEKLVGFNESDYRTWLESTGRQHSVSNLFHFLGWISNKLDSPATIS